eukprot:Gregarina_sp_Pseudo_9__182@NODE_111_length_4201_cov_10_374580_g103_i0_p1_GENE_NODE_111_length_4201_cov_10_374580_g103_i0NODE_111_length_4201_cov_10_374580_g103_i0_p1_ORF_typecomplete_len584_score47_00TPT/PF03151_16/8_9e14UAA/PF08449_11/1_3e12SLC35F/PF06027_12/9_7e02SLC35F/PF06027_12/8_1e13CRTlike/PF08627_10/1_2e10Nuc_sug_transp/PF04142_15/7_3e09MGC24/PF05283_11/0_14MGC24/PF05283_11/1_7e04DUF5353/PF17304_2/3_1DUF5353/PF17304_2/1_2e03DUF5353/PF17304_2/3_1e02_NODE_111_length_4201_cov_10_374580_g103
METGISSRETNVEVPAVGPAAAVDPFRDRPSLTTTDVQSHSHPTRKYQRGKIKWSSAAFIGTILLVLGTTSTVVLHFMDNTAVHPCSDITQCGPTTFESPLIQHLGISFGQAGALIIFVLDKYVLRHGKESQTFFYALTNGVRISSPSSISAITEQSGKETFTKDRQVFALRRAPIAVWLLPAIFDYAEMLLVLNTVGPLSSQARQMIRNAQSFWSAFIATVYLGQSFKVAVWMGICVIFLGLCLAGWTPHWLEYKDDTGGGMVVLGAVLTTIGTCSAAFRWIIQERLARVYHFSVFECIGWCGLYESVFALVGVCIAYWTDTGNIAEGLYLLTHSKVLGLLFLLFIVTVLAMAVVGAMLAQVASSLLTSTILSVRQCSVWLVLVLTTSQRADWSNSVGLVLVALGYGVWNNFWFGSIITPPAYRWLAQYLTFTRREWMCTCICYCPHIPSHYTSAKRNKDENASDGSQMRALRSLNQDSDCMEAGYRQSDPPVMHLAVVALAGGGGGPGGALAAAQQVQMLRLASTIQSARIDEAKSKDSQRSGSTTSMSCSRMSQTGDCWIYVDKEAEWSEADLLGGYRLQ